MKTENIILKLKIDGEIVDVPLGLMIKEFGREINFPEPINKIYDCEEQDEIEFVGIEIKQQQNEEEWGEINDPPYFPEPSTVEPIVLVKTSGNPFTALTSRALNRNQ